MMQSDYFNWSIAVLLSVFFYSAIFMHRGTHMELDGASILQAPLITRLTFNQTLEAVPDVLPVVKPPPAKPIKKIKPKPITTKKVKPLEKIEPVKKETDQAQAQAQQRSVSSEKLLQQKREQYLHKLLTHIESFKFYPRAARKRSIEGEVKVSFNLRDGGRYEQLALDGGRSILVSATRMALEAATPLPVPEDDIKMPKQIEFTMVYSLKQ